MCYIYIHTSINTSTHLSSSTIKNSEPAKNPKSRITAVMWQWRADLFVSRTFKASDVNAKPCNHIFNCPRIDLQYHLEDKSPKDRAGEERTKKNAAWMGTMERQTRELISIRRCILNTGPLIEPHAVRIHSIGQKRQEWQNHGRAGVNVCVYWSRPPRERSLNYAKTSAICWVASLGNDLLTNLTYTHTHKKETTI